jgi:hypothetical protein
LAEKHQCAGKRSPSGRPWLGALRAEIRRIPQPDAYREREEPTQFAEASEVIVDMSGV